MTREDAIEALTSKDVCNPDIMLEALDMAIKALEQEPILDKIRANMIEEKDCAYADFERYKVEYLGQDWEDALDSLPQDDFRYGMERAIEIIDKYKAESEEQNDNYKISRTYRRAIKNP